jgi:phosphatidylglycerol:prolipoprotein diacylglycerol transferase
MIQELFRIGPVVVSPYGVMLVVAFVACYVQLTWGFRHFGIGSQDDASAIVLAAGLGGILGSKVYYAILKWDWHLLFDRAGLVFYGGFLLATVLVIWVIRRRRLPLARTLDLGMVGVALGYGIGRIGCFLVGDDYGRPTDLPWGVVFKVGLPRTTAANLRDFGYELPPGTPGDAWVAVHPTQLYETALALVIWGLVLAFAKGRRLPGSTFLFAVALLSVERFGIEFLRAKDDRFIGPLTLAQVISLVILLVVAALAWRRRRRTP